ncbi:TPA: O-antigen polymerase [Photobacterium damselae]
MNYKILLVSIVISFPTITATIGSLDHVDSWFMFLNFFILCMSTYLCSLYISKKIYFETTIDIKVPGYLYVFLYLMYGYIIVILFKNALLFDFNFSLIRNHLIRDQGIIGLLYDGNVYYRMFFEYIISSVTIALFFLKARWDRWQLILLLLFVLSDVLVGGRFAIYKFIIIIFIRILNKNNTSIRKYLNIVVLFTLISIAIQANRFINGYDSNLSEFIGGFLHSIYLYHSIQPAIILDNLNSSSQFGVFTGLLTPFYMLLGIKSAEGNISDELFRTAFIVGDNSFNAFGTSAIYFTTSYGIIGVSIYALSLILLSFFSIAISNRYKTMVLLKFILFSLFMSMFMPYIWSFSWYITVCVICLVILKCRRG